MTANKDVEAWVPNSRDFHEVDVPLFYCEHGRAYGIRCSRCSEKEE